MRACGRWLLPQRSDRLQVLCDRGGMVQSVEPFGFLRSSGPCSTCGMLSLLYKAILAGGHRPRKVQRESRVSNHLPALSFVCGFVIGFQVIYGGAYVCDLW